MYLEVTYRHGKPLAAYLHLERKPGDVAARTEEIEPGLAVDFAEDGRAIGVEIVSPRTVTAEALNRALCSLHLEPVAAAELAPLTPG
jgi:uncharacterized protein YuzE